MGGLMLEGMDLTQKGDYFMCCFLASLRGIVGFMMDAAGLWHHIGKVTEGPLDHVIIHMMGILKGGGW